MKKGLKNITNLSSQQSEQEGQYIFPYHYLDLVCDDYRYFYNLDYLNLLAIVKRFIKRFKSQSILDAGCGDGRLCWDLMAGGDNLKIVGVDFSDRALSFARAFNPQVSFLRQDLRQLDLKNKFDLITFIETLEHCPPSDVNDILANLQRCLKSDGRIIISVPSTKIILNPKHYQHFTPQSLIQTLEPFFVVEYLVGYDKICFKRSIFDFLRITGTLLFLFRNKLPALKRCLTLAGDYYQRYLGYGPADQCRGLIAVCRQRQ